MRLHRGLPSSLISWILGCSAGESISKGLQISEIFVGSDRNERHILDIHVPLAPRLRLKPNQLVALSANDVLVKILRQAVGAFAVLTEVQAKTFIVFGNAKTHHRLD